MTIALGCDHRGFAAKRELLPRLQALDYRIEDFGCDGATELITRILLVRWRWQSPRNNVILAS
jgi:ribose 5-phosphate isomerase RpiB